MSGFREKTSETLGEKYYILNHKSGLDIYVVKNSLSSVFGIMGTAYGSVDNRFRSSSDSDFTTVPDGIAHFLEHKMFENADGVDTFEKYASTGAQANAYTSFDMTAYLFSCTSDWQQALRVLLETVTSPYFTEETVSKEQGIIGQEIKMGEDNPDRALLFGLLKAMYKNNNVRLEIAGNVDSIAEINAELLYKCYDIFYNLHNMALVIAGNVDLDEIEKIADECLKTAAPFDMICENEKEPREVYKKRFSRSMQVSSPLFAIGIKDANISPDPIEQLKKAAAMAIASDIIFGFSGEFFNSLYERGLIHGDTSPWAVHRPKYSHIIFSGEANDPEAVYTEYREYIEKIKETGVKEEDFNRCKKVFYATLVRAFDSSSSIADVFLSMALGGYDYFDYADAAANVTKEDVDSLIRDFFKEEYTSYGEIYPQGD